mmetsp:Transcript_124549/g.398718  ORF Transcript_124549/g.398718 Transcript_124549/m.398718 type:complete len:240 (+) Transcript_124549:1154-1873(+)
MRVLLQPVGAQMCARLAGEGADTSQGGLDCDSEVGDTGGAIPHVGGRCAANLRAAVPEPPLPSLPPGLRELPGHRHALHGHLPPPDPERDLGPRRCRGAPGPAPALAWRAAAARWRAGAVCRSRSHAIPDPPRQHGAVCRDLEPVVHDLRAGYPTLCAAGLSEARLAQQPVVQLECLDGLLVANRPHAHTRGLGCRAGAGHDLGAGLALPLGLRRVQLQVVGQPAAAAVQFAGPTGEHE